VLAFFRVNPAKSFNQPDFFLLSACFDQSSGQPRVNPGKQEGGSVTKIKKSASFLFEVSCSQRRHGDDMYTPERHLPTPGLGLWSTREYPVSLRTPPATGCLPILPGRRWKCGSKNNPNSCLNTSLASTTSVEYKGCVQDCSFKVLSCVYTLAIQPYGSPRMREFHLYDSLHLSIYLYILYIYSSRPLRPPRAASRSCGYDGKFSWDKGLLFI